MTRFRRGGLANGRAGVGAMWALAVLAILSVIVTLIAAQFVAARRAAEHRGQALQARELARAGVEIAAARMLADPFKSMDEDVEVIPLGKVHVRIQPDPKQADVFRITADARYPTDAVKPAVRSLTRAFRRHTAKEGVVLEALAGPSEGSSSPVGVSP